MVYILCMSVNEVPQVALKIAFDMPRKKSEPSPFGQRLEALRKTRGLTQLQVAKALGTTQRTVSYYENQGGSPPAHVVITIATAAKEKNLSSGKTPHTIHEAQAAARGPFEVTSEVIRRMTAR